MATQAQIETSRRNGRKSKGPVTAEGRLKVSMNALKHGRNSKKAEFLRENSLSFETRQHKWMAKADPRDDAEEFLVHRQVAISFEVERADRAHLQRLRSAIDNAEEAELEAVEALGERLLNDPAGPHALHGILPYNRTEVKKTSGDGAVVPDPSRPSVLLKKLLSSEVGCIWLRSHWEELRAKLDEPPNNWQAFDRLTAIRLLGYQPVQALQKRVVAEIFVATFGLNPQGEDPFDDLLSDMTSTQHDQYLIRTSAAWPGLETAAEPANAREILIDLCESNIDELNEALQAFKQNADATADATYISLGLDQSAEGQNVRNYVRKCDSALFRVADLLKKRQRDNKTDEAQAYQEPRRIPDASRWPSDRDRRMTPAASGNPPSADEQIDIAWALGPYPQDQRPDTTPPPLLPGEGRAEGLAPSIRQENDDGKTHEQENPGDQLPDTAPLRHLPAGGSVEGLPQASSLPGDGDGTTLEEDCHFPAAGEADRSHEMSAADAMAEHGDDTTQQGEHAENVENEPKVDEPSVIAKTHENVGISANQGVTSALDKPCPTSVVGGHLPPGGPALKPHPPGQARPPQQSKRERKARIRAEQKMRDQKFKELRLTFEDKIRAGQPLDQQMLTDFSTAAAEVARMRLPPAPRSP